MKIALKDGQILIRDANSTQLQIIKSWGKMQWSRVTQTFSGPADRELLDRLAGLVKLPEPMERERERLNTISQAVDKERLNETPKPLIDMPIKVKPYKHQIRGYNMALMTLELVEPPKEENESYRAGKRE